jgi:hypothetical protein
MIQEIYIYHHLGLGDHIICNAIVRNYANKYDKIYLFVKQHNYESVKFMYKDLHNINFLIGDDNFAEKTILNKKNIIKIGFDKLNRNIKFDKSFYNQLGLNFNKRWEDFYFERNLEKELDLFKLYSVEENNYIFLHDDYDRNFKIPIINKSIQIINPKKKLTNNIFDYCYLIENAKEIHCIDSSFKILADSINLKTNILFYYLNRRQDYNLYSSSRNKWIEI